MDKFKDCEVVRKSLSEMNPAEYNPRKISEKAAEGLANSMEEFGLLVPIIWNKRSGNIVGGHQRYDRLKAAGETEADVVVVDLDDNEEVALNIALNSREIRGDFTAEIVGLLELSEAQIGNLFGDIGLMDLHEQMKKVKFDIDVDGKKDKKKSSGDGDTGDGGWDDNDDDHDIPPSPDAVITCPKCKSRWKMKDNSIIHNAAARGDSDE